MKPTLTRQATGRADVSLKKPPSLTLVSALYRHDPQALSGTRAARPPVDVIVHGGRLRLGYRRRVCSTR